MFRFHSFVSFLRFDSVMKYFLNIGLTWILLLSFWLPRLASCSAEVVIEISDVTLSPDGVGTIQIKAYDESPQTAKALSSFNIGIQIRELSEQTERLQILDNGWAGDFRDDPDYIFRDKSALPADAGGVELRNGVLTITDFINFTEPAVSLATPQFLAEFQVAAAPGFQLNSQQQFSIVVIDDPNDQTDLLFFDGTGTQIATPRIVGGNILIAAAVPEPGSAMVLMLINRELTGEGYISCCLVRVRKSTTEQSVSRGKSPNASLPPASDRTRL